MRARAASVGGESPTVRAKVTGLVDDVIISPIKGALCKEKFVEPLPEDYADLCPPPTGLKKLGDTSIEFDSVMYQESSTKKLKLNAPFFDKSFPTDHPTHYHLPPGDLARGTKQKPEKVVWKRITDIFRNVEFIHDNKPRPDDILQGRLGDCWFLGAVATLATSSTFFEMVVPKPWPSPAAMNPADEKYEFGIFRFRFWKWGKWVEVVVDDRLPFLANSNGSLRHPPQLAFGACKNISRDFWVPLIEKAYAKLHGSYAALEAGSAADAMMDLTGGIVETIDMKKMGTKKKKLPKSLQGDEEWDYSVLWKRFKKAQQKGFLLSCSNKSEYDSSRAQQKIIATGNGIVLSHAYSISRVISISVRNPKGINIFHKDNYNLIAVRNPWGEHSWNGAWSVTSKEWKSLSKSQKKDLGLLLDESGTFWMSIEDFILNFTHVNICRTFNTSFLSLHHQWERFYFFGIWHHPYNAGGCINHSTWHQNPQYRLKTSKDSHIIISLQQKEARLFCSSGTAAEGLSMGFHLLHIEKNRKTRIHVPMDSVNTKTHFINSRQITFAGQLPRGTYMIIPCTYNPKQEGEFLLQVYTFCNSKCKFMKRDVPKKKIFQSRVKNALSITVHNASLTKLKGFHTSMAPYVRVTVENTTLKTICRENTSPTFDEGLLFYPKDPKNAVIKFEVYHSGVLLDTHLGACSFPISSIANRKQGVRYSSTCRLRGKDPLESFSTGSLSFSVYFQSQPELL